MPDIAVGAQIFDFAFHPSHSTVYTGSLTGDVKAFTYDEQGQSENRFSLRPSKRSCRALALNLGGNQLWAGGKARTLHVIDTTTATVVGTRKDAHDAPINRARGLLPNMLCSGDDEGAVKLWDPRKPDAVRAFNVHSDYISDFLWLEDKRQLVSTSGDCTLSVVDVRGKNGLLAQSDDQEDELLSIVSIRGGTKAVVGTQCGVFSVFNRSSGWGDCVDRVPGHPHSIDALCTLPPSYTYTSSSSTVLTGSSDGLLRAVQLFPTKLIGVVADHGDFPIERVSVDRAGEGHWVGSIGHEDLLRLTDLKDVFEDEEDGQPSGGDEGRSSADRDSDSERGSPVDEQIEEAAVERDGAQTLHHAREEGLSSGPGGDEEAGSEVGEESDGGSAVKRRKRKPVAANTLKSSKKRRNEVEAEPSFFSDL